MTDDELILYFYDELPAAERRALGALLERDAALAARYRDLAANLSGWTADDAAPLADDLRRRLHARIDSAADLERGRRQSARPRSHWTSFLLGAGVAATVAVAIMLGLRQAPHTPTGPQTNPPDMTAAVATDTAGLPATFARAMQVHFRDSRQEVAGLPDTGNGNRTAMIADLIEQNRSFARLATQNDSPELARVLRAFEPILVRLAAEDITAEESAALRDQLAFELNVMLTKLTREASMYATSTDQETST